MPTTLVYWEWEDAFYKFGFDDGDGPNFTTFVADILAAEGYEMEMDRWGCHNFMIHDITKDGETVFEEGATVGYDDPRLFLPAEITDLLDKVFPSDILFDREGRTIGTKGDLCLKAQAT